MTEVVPSYLKKLTRAEKHLNELKTEVKRYGDSHPYEITEGIEGQTKKRRGRFVRRLEFTRLPENTDIGIIAADVIYNIRSGLDHLAAALVPPSRRSHTMFPIFWTGVWEDPVEGENEQRTRDRQRWASVTKKMQKGAIEHLKLMQPRPGRDQDPIVNFLRVLNQLSNTDRHEKLPIMVTALRNEVISWTEPGGRRREGHDPRTRQPGAGVNNHAEIQGIPEDATNVQIEGTPLIVIQVSEPRNQFELVEMLETAIPRIRENGVLPLAQFLWQG